MGEVEVSEDRVWGPAYNLNRNSRDKIWGTPEMLRRAPRFVRAIPEGEVQNRELCCVMGGGIPLNLLPADRNELFTPSLRGNESFAVALVVS